MGLSATPEPVSLMSFNQAFDEHSAWRQGFVLQLQRLADWLSDHDLLGPDERERLDRLRDPLKHDRIMVAFVAEFSRGKSELINAVFFANHGRRIMPASAGRTTMCPTELAYDPQWPACLRLLPIETRLQPLSLQDWRQRPDQWERIDLDVDDAQQLAQAMQRVTQVRRVPPSVAASLGFWNADSPHDNPPLGSDGLVEIPHWRHALINMAHPLLRQGLVILDTPGLNAVGAEPELTVSLLPQAQAVVFILAADAGVTQSDLTIWRQHLAGLGLAPQARLVVLNKIDTLWDTLSTPQQVQGQIAAQCAQSAQLLDLPAARVLAVSAQKGLLAKIHKDDALLQASRLPDLEQALGEGLLGQRRHILRQAMAQGVQWLQQQVAQRIRSRQRDLLERTQELDGLRGKNSGVIKHLRLRIEQEQAEFEASGARIQAVRSVHLRLLKDLFALLGHSHLKQAVADWEAALQQPGIKRGVRRAYEQTFERLRTDLGAAEQLTAEIQTMLEASFRTLNAEYGFALRLPPAPSLAPYRRDLEHIERGHLQYLGVGQTLRLAQPVFAERLARALMSRLRGVYSSAISDIEGWSKSAAAQLDAQLRERRLQFGRRIEAISRIQQAAGGLEERLRELQAEQDRLQRVQAQWKAMTDELLATSAVADTPAAPPPSQALQA